MALHTKRLVRPQLIPVRQNSWRIALKTVTAAAVGVVLAFTQAGTGHAEPTQAELEAQIDTQWNQLEPTIEQHNKLKAELAANQAKVQELTDKLRPLELQVDLALTRVSGISARYYKGGNASVFNAILTTGSPTTLADQLSLLDHIARAELTQIKDAIELKQQYDKEKAPLDVLLEEQTKQEAELAAKEKSIRAEVQRLNDLRIKAFGTTESAGSTQPVPCPYEYIPSAGGRAAKVACQQIGKSYVFGSSGPKTFDCSGLTMYAWAHANAGVTLRHYTQWQYQDTKRVTKSQLQPGDLIFYYSDRHHVGMYVGGGWIVHAPHSGDVVRMKRFDSAPISGYGRPVSSA
ncbi:MAG: hypothetical protein HKP61_11640 [Dactylosporangium sp.]|nr:C40 family peptidase [Dactylosporangium sp.]NNJ61577.1 hypothetical protein [Dactylosporangium sp.]